MKKIILSFGLLIAFNFAHSQVVKDTLIVWVSGVNVYDSLGNVTIYQRTFHSIPTCQDTLDFGIRRDQLDPADKPRRK